jgi:hypothetical protein
MAGACDGLEIEMAVLEKESRIVFTLPCKTQDDESLILSDPEREIPSGSNATLPGKICIIIGKVLNERQAAAYLYAMEEKSRSRNGMDFRFDSLVALGTKEQIQCLVNAQLRRIS